MLGFKYKKAVQALNYFSIRENGSINKMKALKLIWLSDRLHIRLYGRPITNDTYFAMRFGPVPSNAKDLAENTPFIDDEERDYRDTFIKSGNDGYFFSSNAPIESNVFSETDIKALQAVYDAFGMYSEFQLSELSHNYPEWKKFEQSLSSIDISRFEMSYLDFFNNPVIDNKDIFLQDEEYLEESKELYQENNTVHTLL